MDRPRSSRSLGRGQTSGNASAASSGVARWHSRGRRRLPAAPCHAGAMTSRRAFAIALLAARAGALATPAIAARTPVVAALPRATSARIAMSRIEWWYVTGALDAAARTWGFQITFFRVRDRLRAAPTPAVSRRASWCSPMPPSPISRARRLRHDQRIARSGFGIAEAPSATPTCVAARLAPGAAARDASRYRARAGERAAPASPSTSR